MINQSAVLNHLLAGLTEDQIPQRPEPNKWSIFENMTHLGHYQEVFIERLVMISTEEVPSFSRYIAYDNPGFASWAQLSLQELQGRIQAKRAAIQDFLDNLRGDQLTRVGLHPAYGPITIDGWTQLFLLHEAHHFFTILKLGGALRAGEQPMGLH